MNEQQVERAKDRVLLLVKETVLKQPAQNIVVNAPVAILQIAFQNELNGILLGLGLAEERVIKLPISDTTLRSITKAIKHYGATKNPKSKNPFDKVIIETARLAFRSGALWADFYGPYYRKKNGNIRSLKAANNYIKLIYGSPSKPKK